MPTQTYYVPWWAAWRISTNLRIWLAGDVEGDRCFAIIYWLVCTFVGTSQQVGSWLMWVTRDLLNHKQNNKQSKPLGDVEKLHMFLVMSLNYTSRGVNGQSVVRHKINIACTSLEDLTLYAVCGEERTSNSSLRDFTKHYLCLQQTIVYRYGEERSQGSTGPRRTVISSRPEEPCSACSIAGLGRTIYICGGNSTNNKKKG